MFKSTKSWLPAEYIKDGIIKCKSGHFCKIIEVTPINFKLKSIREQENILYQYKNFLKTCDFDMQILVKSKRSDIDEHVKNIEKKLEKEISEPVREIIAGYIENLRKEILIKKNITRKFFIIIKHTVPKGTKDINLINIAADFEEKVSKIRDTLSKCGNEIIDFGRNDDKIAEIIYEELNKNISQVQKFKSSQFNMQVNQ